MVQVVVAPQINVFLSPSISSAAIAAGSTSTSTSTGASVFPCDGVRSTCMFRAAKTGRP